MSSYKLVDNHHGLSDYWKVGVIPCLSQHPIPMDYLVPQVFLKNIGGGSQLGRKPGGQKLTAQGTF